MLHARKSQKKYFRNLYSELDSLKSVYIFGIIGGRMVKSMGNSRPWCSPHDKMTRPHMKDFGEVKDKYKNTGAEKNFPLLCWHASIFLTALRHFLNLVSILKTLNNKKRHWVDSERVCNRPAWQFFWGLEVGADEFYAPLRRSCNLKLRRYRQMYSHPNIPPAPI